MPTVFQGMVRHSKETITAKWNSRKRCVKKLHTHTSSYTRRHRHTYWIETDWSKITTTNSSARANATTNACQVRTHLILRKYIRAFRFDNDFSTFCWHCVVVFHLLPWLCFISIYCICNAMYLIYSIYWKQCVVGTSSNHSPSSRISHHAPCTHRQNIMQLVISAKAQRTWKTLENWNGTWDRLDGNQKSEIFSINYLCDGKAW